MQAMTSATPALETKPAGKSSLRQFIAFVAEVCGPDVSAGIQEAAASGIGTRP